jgi:hypothetical protein
VIVAFVVEPFAIVGVAYSFFAHSWGKHSLCKGIASKGFVVRTFNCSLKFSILFKFSFVQANKKNIAFFGFPRINDTLYNAFKNFTHFLAKGFFVLIHISNLSLFFLAIL